MNKKIITMLALLLVPFIGTFGQHMPLLNVPSPEIAGLGEYGTVPVGLYTGVPDISVSLHEMQAGGQSFPITANYHLSSVKPQLQEGCLALGWSLQTGGYISRSVNGMYDEKMHADGYAPGYYANAYRLKGMTNEQFTAATRNIRSNSSVTSYYELSADEFSFNFFGYTGTFYYNEDGGWTVISDQDIRVEFNPADGEGFVKLDGLRPEIEHGSWGVQDYNDRFFNKFTLVTPDGCCYEFGGINATEYSISYYNRNNSDLIATTWQLSKIVTPDNRTVTYHYEATDLLCDLKYVPQAKTLYNAPCTPHNPSRGRDAMTGFLIMPVRLAGISTPDEEISFDYFEDLAYSSHFWAAALGWNVDEYYPEDIYHPAQEFERRQFSLFMHTTLDYTTSPLLQQSIQKNLKHSTLHRIGIRSKNSAVRARSVYFDYTFKNRRKLALVALREGVPALIPDYVSAPGKLVLRGYKVPVSPAPGKDPEYKFAYNTERPMPTSYTNPETDYWGYYVGSNVSFSAIPQFKKPTPNLIFSQSDVLTEITYPTGAKSRFEYVLNNYSKIVDITHTRLDNQLGNAGGLRVAAVSRHDRNGVLLDKKKYYYAEDRKAGSASSGILREAPVYEIIYTASEDVILKQQSEGGYFASVTNQNSPVVGYSCVIEETLDSVGHSKGYIKRRYSNYGTDLYGMTHFDEPALYSNAGGESVVKPFTSRSAERGKLLSEEFYNNSDKLLKKKVQHYKTVNSGEFRSAHQTVAFFCTDLDYESFSYACIGTLTRVYTHSYLPDSIAETVYPSEGNVPGYNVGRTFSYNNHKLLKQEKTLTSKGGSHTVGYTYPADHSNYQWMVDAHLLSPVVEKTTVEGGKSLKETYTYGYRNQGSRYMPYVKSTGHRFDALSSRTDYLVDKTDAYANPVVTVSRGVSSVLLWSYEGRQLIARIENATYGKVMSLLGKSPESFSTASKPDNTAYRLIENIRHRLPKALVTIYKYTSGMQLESVTSPAGQTVFYKYDYLDRLREEYFYDQPSGLLRRKLLNVYDYHYQH